MLLWNQLCFVHVFDFLITFGIFSVIPCKHPKGVWEHFVKHWSAPFGVPRGEELEGMGCELMPPAASNPQQNVVCERYLQELREMSDGRVQHQIFAAE